MNVGFDYLAQVADGFVQKTIRSIVSAIQAGYHTQHNANDTHKTITATGPISERGRTTAMGAWTPVVFVASSYSAPTGSTWTVAAANQYTLNYALVGATLFLMWYIEESRLSVGAAKYVTLLIPGNFVSIAALGPQFGTFTFDDNGSRGTGMARVDANSTTIKLYKDIRGNGTWGVSGNLSMAGQMAFQIAV